MNRVRGLALGDEKFVSLCIRGIPVRRKGSRGCGLATVYYDRPCVDIRSCRRGRRVGSSLYQLVRRIYKVV